MDFVVRKDKNPQPKWGGGEKPETIVKLRKLILGFCFDLVNSIPCPTT